MLCEIDLGATTPTRSATPTPAPSPSAPCPVGWSFYDDSASTSADAEGHDSCVAVFNGPGNTATFVNAPPICNAKLAGAKLLTIRSTNATAATNGLFNLALQLAIGLCAAIVFAWTLVG